MIKTEIALIKEIDMEQNVENKQNKKLIVGLIFNWLIIAFVSLFVVLFLKGLVSIVGSQPWFYDILEKQFVTVIGLPLSALASLCLVILLEVRSGLGCLKRPLSLARFLIQD